MISGPLHLYVNCLAIDTKNLIQMRILTAKMMLYGNFGASHTNYDISEEDKQASENPKWFGQLIIP